MCTRSAVSKVSADAVLKKELNEKKFILILLTYIIITIKGTVLYFITVPCCILNMFGLVLTTISWIIFGSNDDSCSFFVCMGTDQLCIGIVCMNKEKS